MSGETLITLAEARAREIDPLAWTPEALSAADPTMVIALQTRRAIALRTAMQQIETVAFRLLAGRESFGPAAPIDSRRQMRKPHIKKLTKRRGRS